MIVDHKLKDAEYDPARTIKGEMVPEAIVMHYTAGYSVDSARRVFKTSSIAAHLTIGTYGTILQMVPFNRGANHAGPSKYAGKSYLNNWSIGIEHVNIGFLKYENGRYVDSYGNTWNGNPDDLVKAKHPRVGSGTYYWPKYPEAQLAASERCVRDLIAAYPSIKYIVSHEEIDTRGWKTDPGPAFPMNRFTSLLSGKGPRVVKTRGKSIVDDLNVRTGPGIQYGMATKWPLYEGQEIDILGSSGDWLKVLINDYAEGWVHGAYVRRI